MVILFCPVCGWRIGVYETGKLITCPNCDRAFVVEADVKPKKPRKPGPSEVK